jgi:hypothetical protein
MIESLLVADDGLGAVRVVAAAHRLGIKAVVLTATERRRDVRGADDVVLLPTREWTAQGVAAAAVAADVDAVHPGMGPLLADAALAAAAADAGLATVLTRGQFAGAGLAAAIGPAGLEFDPTGAADLEVLVFGRPTGVTVLGELRLDAAGRAHAPAELSDDERADAHRRAHAVAAAIGLDGLAGVGLHAATVRRVRPGLSPQQSAWQAVSGIDVVELQVRHLAGAEPIDGLGPGQSPPVQGAAVAFDLAEAGDSAAGSAAAGTVHDEHYTGTDGIERTWRTVGP